jgi:hypothetical protein
MAALWHYGEPFYVTLYGLVDGQPSTYLGWLGNAGVASDYAQPVEGPSDGPPPAGATQVQWVFDAQKGDATDQASYEAELATRPRYLSSEGRVLGGAEGQGFYLYWWSVNIEEGYPLTAGDTSESGIHTLSRVSALIPGCSDPAGSAISTYGNYLGYYNYDGEYTTVGFHFQPVATLNQATHPTWINDRRATIGDRPLPQIVIPGSHDAGAYQISRGGGEMTSRAQQVDIMAQLLAGSRYLDLRTDMYQGVWYIRHGSDWTWVRFDHVVDQLGRFLDAPPNEFVLVSLLVADTKGVPGMSGDYKNAWQMLFNRVHANHLNYTDEAGNRTDITQVTPNTLQQSGKNLLVFSWGAAASWYFDVDAITREFIRYAEKDDPLAPGTTRIFVSPWASKPEGQAPQGDIADFEGVYLDLDVPPMLAPAAVRAIYQGYLNYQRTGGLWNLQTNLPWEIYNLTLSLYNNHTLITPGIVNYLQGGDITRSKANIINMDYLGDAVVSEDVSYDLVSAVIALNDT